MPIKIQGELPVKEILEKENILLWMKHGQSIRISVPFRF